MAHKIVFSKFTGLLLFVVFVLTACGGNSSQNNAQSDATAAPTRTPFPTFEYVAPATQNAFGQGESTQEANAPTSEAVVVAVELDPVLVERGLGRYEALECAICHGENGEGTAQIVGFTDFALSEDAFITFMRSGGTIGSSHQYSTDRLSNNGSHNLYLYLVSLAQSE